VTGLARSLQEAQLNSAAVLVYGYGPHADAHPISA